MLNPLSLHSFLRSAMLDLVLDALGETLDGVDFSASMSSFFPFPLEGLTAGEDADTALAGDAHALVDGRGEAGGGVARTA
jgi:hypothetical protein